MQENMKSKFDYRNLTTSTRSYDQNMKLKQ